VCLYSINEREEEGVVDDWWGQSRLCCSLIGAQEERWRRKSVVGGGASAARRRRRRSALKSAPPQLSQTQHTETHSISSQTMVYSYGPTATTPQTGVLGYLLGLKVRDPVRN
jgi:hypothetical protein